MTATRTVMQQSFVTLSPSQQMTFRCLMPTEQVRYRQWYEKQSGEGRPLIPYRIQARPCQRDVRRISLATAVQFAPSLVEIGSYFTQDPLPDDRVPIYGNIPLYVSVMMSPLHAVLYMNLSHLQMNRFKYEGKFETRFFIGKCAVCTQERPLRCKSDWCTPCLQPIKTIVQGMFPKMSFPLMLDPEMPEYDLALLVFRSAYLALKYALRRYLKRRRQIIENVRLWAQATKEWKYRTMKFALPWDVVVSVGRWIQHPIRRQIEFEEVHYKRRLRRPNYEALCEQDAATYFKTAQEGVMDVGQRQWTKRQKREPKRDVVDVYLKELYTVTSTTDLLQFKEAVLARRMTIYINV